MRGGDRIHRNGYLARQRLHFLQVGSGELIARRKCVVVHG